MMRAVGVGVTIIGPEAVFDVLDLELVAVGQAGVVADFALQVLEVYGVADEDLAQGGDDFAAGGRHGLEVLAAGDLE